MSASNIDIAGNTTNNPLPHQKPENKKSGKKRFFSYILLPGIIPQIRELGRGGFGYLALLIASVYQAVRILPAGHAYTQYNNLGKFGIRDVIAAAANNVKLDRKNIDQVVIFFAVIAGLILLTLQFVAFILLIVSGDAFAGTPAPAAGMFTTANPQEDVAFHMLREVFGIPDLFGTLDGGQTSFHKALHVLFNFYNLAILVVAILVFIYYVIVVVGETAQSGTPFGQRFSHIYAPFRLVIAIGLLVPLNHGLNGAQYITLNAAKIGSSFATTGWIQFNTSLDSTNPLGAENASLIAQTKEPDFTGLVEFMALAVTCKEAYKISEPDIEIKKYCNVPKSETDQTLEYTLCEGASGSEGAMKKLKNQDMQVKFGAQSAAETGVDIIGYCGTATVPYAAPQTGDAKNGNPGELQGKYLKLLDDLWMGKGTKDKAPNLKTMGKAFACKFSAYGNGLEDNNPDSCTKVVFPNKTDIQKVLSDYRTKIKKMVNEHYEDARNKADFKMREETRKLGWGGSGIWYNRIAQINGAYVTATLNIPAGNKWPHVMQLVLENRQTSDGSFRGCKAFEPNQADNKKMQLTETDRYYARTFNAAYQYWTCDKKSTSNFFLDSLSAVFGLSGLLSIRDTAEVKVEVTNEDGFSGVDVKTVQIHPLAKLSALGKGLVESAIRNMAFAMGSSFLGGMVGILSPHMGASLDAASSMFVSIATIGLSIGFITYYILPFLPFIYFFFAVGGWVKSIFEAMVGAPLWALAHLKIDGDGLPGQMAMNGYFLIFEIFLRPILTVFGLLGGMAIFTALAAMLNEIFDLVVLNTASVELDKDVGQYEFSRHIVDVFFFTCVYAVILYMMAVSSFKMINLVPNNILRWMGQSVSSFSDQTEDPTQGLTQYAAIGGARIGGQLAGGMTQLSKAGGGVPGGLFGALANKK